MWFKSYLENRFTSVKIGNDVSDMLPLKYGVPQGSVLGPVIFTMYTQNLSSIISLHALNYHLYADDTQLYGFTTTDNVQNLIDRITRCINDIGKWMLKNKLKLNEDKTEILFIRGSACKDIDNINININGHEISAQTKIKNLGVVLDPDMSMKSHVSNLCKSLYLQLKKIGSIRKYLSVDVTKTLITSLILSRLDYCNSLLAGVPDEQLQQLQRVQNIAAKIISKKLKHDHVTPILKELHWLPVKERIIYKICLTCYKCVNDLSPDYLKQLLTPYVPPRALRSSSDKTTLLKPKINYKSYGQRSFSYFAPLVWNRLPKTIREAGNLESFKKKLKTFLFSSYFD